MTTRAVAEMLAGAAGGFQDILGPVAPADLLAVVTSELGHEEALDRFCIQHSNARSAPPGQRITHFARALPPGTILHAFETAAPQPAIHSLMCGLLLGAHNLCKIPSGGLPELRAFRDLLPRDLMGEVEISESLPASWIDHSDAIVVHGSEELIAWYRARIRPWQIFVAKRRRLAFGAVFEDSLYESIPAAAADVSMYDQRGPFSPHLIYVAETGHLDPLTYARQLASAMEEFERRIPRRPLDPDAEALIANVRTSYRFKASSDRKSTAIWESSGSTAWTVIFESDPSFATSCLDRLVFVKPMPRSFAVSLAQARPMIGAVAIHPATQENAAILARAGVSRICPFGRLHTPIMSWHNDAGQNLAPLVRWVDYEQPTR